MDFRKILRINKLQLSSFIFFMLLAVHTWAQKPVLKKQAENAMLRASKFMIDEVSTNGGFVWYYLPDLSRRWGEMEAYKTMIWVQGGGTVSAGHVFLDAYRATGNEYYYQAAEKTAAALIWGQSNAGGWHYMIDFAGDRSLKNWYSTIGKNGWRLEEFQHYYGNDTFDDEVTSDAARFLLRIYLEKLDPKYKPALDKAIGFILKSQYPNGGWPQRYPLKNDFKKDGNEDYTSYYTFNDNVIWENVNFLIQCYLTLGEERFLAPINQGMNFYYISQAENGAWGQQYNLKMEPAAARTYEPAAYLPSTTFRNAMIMMRFYQYTGDKKYLSNIPKAIAWLESVKLPDDKTMNGRYTHPQFIEVKTGKPVYPHRKGSNATFGKYYVDYNDHDLLGHYGGKTKLDLEYLKDEYKRISSLSPEEASEGSPLKAAQFEGSGLPQHYYSIKREIHYNSEVSEAQVKGVITALDEENRWLVEHVMISNPYIGDGKDQEETRMFATTNVGDKTDTSPFRDTSDQKYISTPEFIKNMSILIRYIENTSIQHAGGDVF